MFWQTRAIWSDAALPRPSNALEASNALMLCDGAIDFFWINQALYIDTCCQQKSSSSSSALSTLVKSRSTRQEGFENVSEVSSLLLPLAPQSSHNPTTWSISVEESRPVNVEGCQLLLPQERTCCGLLLHWARGKDTNSCGLWTFCVTQLYHVIMYCWSFVLPHIIALKFCESLKSWTLNWFVK